MGACSLRNFLKFRGYEIASETIFGPMQMLLGGKTTESHMYEYLPIVLYSNGFGFPIVRVSCKPHPLQMKLVRLIVRLEEWKAVVGRLRRILSHCLQPSCKIQHVTCVLGGVRQALALIGNTKQAKSEGEKWSD